MTAGNYRGKHYTEWVEKVKDLKRDGQLDEALTLLHGLVEAVEREATTKHWGVAPWYYEQIAIICRKQGDLTGEMAILQRYDSQPAAPGSTAPKLAARLRKVTELIDAAEAAGAPPACPGCGVLLDSHPAKTANCPDCGAQIVVRKRSGQAQLFTREQADSLKIADDAAREREKALLLAGRLGFDEGAFDRQSDELSDRFGSPARPSDVYWALTNQRVIALAEAGNLYGLPFVHAEQAKFLHGEGRDWTQAARSRAQATLASLANYPELVFMRCPCPPCQALPQRTYTSGELQASMPVPHVDCERPPCGCSPSPKRSEDGGLSITYEIELQAGVDEQRPKRSLLKRLFG